MGESSSITKPAHVDWWNSPKYKGDEIDVPVNTLKSLLDAIPKDKEITEMRTDMQGQDLNAIKSAGVDIQRVQDIQSEVYTNGHPSYKDTVNSENEWSKLMGEMGFGNVDCKKGYHWEKKCHYKQEDGGKYSAEDVADLHQF